LLLISGPRKINGVPLRRVSQAYVIATSTKLDISSVKVDAKFTDEYFKGDRIEKKKATEAALLGGFEKKPVTAERAADQKALDSMLLPLVKKQPMMSQYLNASFALSKGQYPHSIKF
jgi:large subunit ribosomal protein L6e